MRFFNESRREMITDEIMRAATRDFVYDFATYVCAAVAWYFFDPILTPIALCAAMLYGSKGSGRSITWFLPALLLNERRLARRCIWNTLYFIGFGIISGLAVTLIGRPDLSSNIVVRAFLVANTGIFLLAFVAGFAETYAHVRRIKTVAVHSELASALATATPLAASVMGGMIGLGDMEAAISATGVLLVNLFAILLGSACWMVWMRLRWFI